MSDQPTFERRTLLTGGAAAVAASALPTAHAAVPRAGARQVGDFAARLDAMRAAAGVTGASFAYWDGNILHTAVSGLRNSVTGDPVTADTIMHVGSITKVMNAALVMQLVDDGKIALSDPVTRHLPDLRIADQSVLERISCAMLINHTSGIDGEWLPEYGPDQERIVDTIIRCAPLGMLFAPGTETSYNNIATVIAGHLVQTLRGKSWYTIVKSNLYEPLGMAHAMVDPLELPRFRASIGDLTDRTTGKMVQTTRPFLAPSFAPAGSTQMTSAVDLVAFARALIAGGVGPNGKRILSDASAKAMATPTASFIPVGGEETKVGLGWMILQGGLLAHGGSGPGIRSNLYVHPASGRALALLTNSDNGEKLRSAFVDPIVRSWIGVTPVKLSRRADTGDVRPFVGIYETNADRYTIAAEAGTLTLRYHDKLSTYDNSNQDAPPRILFPLGDGNFEEDTTKHGAEPRMIRFVRPGADGRMRFLASGTRLLARVS